MKKFVLETGGPSNYFGNCVESRVLYNTYESAKAKYDSIIKEGYQDKSDEEMKVIREECEGQCCGDRDFLDDWIDDENDIYMYIYSVEVAEE